jgi:hypothetical protein
MRETCKVPENMLEIQRVGREEKTRTEIKIQRIFLDFFHRPVFQKNTTFRKLDLFPSSDEGGKENTYSVGPLRES